MRARYDSIMAAFLRLSAVMYTHADVELNAAQGVILGLLAMCPLSWSVLLCTLSPECEPTERGCCAATSCSLDVNSQEMTVHVFVSERSSTNELFNTW